MTPPLDQKLSNDGEPYVPFNDCENQIQNNSHEVFISKNRCGLDQNLPFPVPREFKFIDLDWEDYDDIEFGGSTTYNPLMALKGGWQGYK